jgi:glycosyltransferase involved in cell wall biosynthesis
MSPKAQPILMVLDSPYPPDPRVEAEAMALREAGHEVVLFCLQRDRQKPEREDAPFGRVIRAYQSPLWHKMSALAWDFPLYHRWLAGELAPVLREVNPAVVHIHDIQSAGAVWRAMARTGMRPAVVQDLHENRPEIMKHYHHVSTGLGRVLISPARWKRAEEAVVNRADAVITVTPEAADELRGRPSISQETFAVVPNSVERAYAERNPAHPRAAAVMTSSPNVLYLGDTGRRRGLETAIRALALLKEDFPQMKLTVVGKGQNDRDYADLARALGVADMMAQEGWQYADLFPAYLRKADIGISPLHRNIHHDTTYANKIFQYMAFGLAQVVSDCPAQARIIREADCGIVHRAEDAEDMARALRQLCEQPALLRAMGERGAKALRTTYCREAVMGELIDLYARLARP